MPHPKIVSVLTATLILINLLCTAVPSLSAAPGRSDLQTREQEQIDAYIQARIQAAHIPGLALGVVRGKEVAYLKGYGIAGPDGRSVTPQTPFILGSTSKSFTALAIMQLVEAGKIDLDASVTNYLPWFRTADEAASARITVRNLLNQDSGLPVDAGREGFSENDQSDTALENGVRQLAGVQLNHPAGQTYEYANENYTMLGLIIQAVSGRSYEEYIQSQIFAPLHMRHSAASISDPAVKDLASGYRSWLFWPVPFDAPYPRRMTPAGLLISSAEDMAHYVIAQLNGGAYGENQVVSPAGVATLHTTGATINSTSAYGMGWVIHHQPQATRFEHNGDTSTFHSNMLLLPEEQIGIVVLTNIGGVNNAAAMNIPIEGVAAILLGHSLSPSVEACRRVFASNTRWTVVRGSDLEEGESQGLPLWSRHVGDPLLKSNMTRRVDSALFMVAAIENDELIHEATAIVSCRTPSALVHAAIRDRMAADSRGNGSERQLEIGSSVPPSRMRSTLHCPGEARRALSKARRLYAAKVLSITTEIVTRPPARLGSNGTNEYYRPPQGQGNVEQTQRRDRIHVNQRPIKAGSWVIWVVNGQTV